MKTLIKHDIPYGRPIIGDEERNAVMEVMRGHILVHGPKAHEFESAFARFTGATHAVSVSSATAALHLCYFYLGLGPGDEVIVTAETHVATAHGAELTGAKCVFVDAEEKTGNIDIDQIESKITSRTKAIGIVHYLGMPVDMDRLNAIAKKHGLFVVEDAALALGTYYKGRHAGTLGDAGCFSFYPVKHMTTAEGGMLTTKHEEMAKKVSRQKAFGVDKSMQERAVPGIYDAPYLGLNYRMNEIQAAIGIEQLKRMKSFLEAREMNFNALYAKLKGLDELHLFESTHGEFKSSYYCLGAVLKKKWRSKRVEFIQAINKQGVGTSVHYPKAVPQLAYYKKKYGHAPSNFPVADWISESSVALPVGPHLKVEDMECVAEAVKNALQEVMK
jgi:perosamine synthetase